MDSYGDHLVSCKFNQPIQRHNALCDALADALKENKIACNKEVAIGGSRRPADLALPTLDSRGPTAIDLVVYHPLSMGSARSVLTVRRSVRDAELAKIRDSEELCHGNGWLFSPMGWHPWGGVGPHGSAMIGRLEKVIAGDLQGWPKRNAIGAFRKRLTFALMAFVAKQLKAAEDARQHIPLHPDQFAAPNGPVFSPAELNVWDEEQDLPLFVGPIRITSKPPKLRNALAPGGPLHNVLSGVVQTGDTATSSRGLQSLC